jgi:hypothetical protein
MTVSKLRWNKFDTSFRQTDANESWVGVDESDPPGVLTFRITVFARGMAHLTIYHQTRPLKAGAAIDQCIAHNFKAAQEAATAYWRLYRLAGVPAEGEDRLGPLIPRDEAALQLIRKLIARQKGDRTYEELQAASDDVVKAQRWNQIANGIRITNFPKPETIAAMAKALDVDVDVLLLTFARQFGLGGSNDV